MHRIAFLFLSLSAIWLFLFHLLPENSTDTNLFYRIAKNGQFGYNLFFVTIGYSLASKNSNLITNKVIIFQYSITLIVWIISLITSSTNPLLYSDRLEYYHYILISLSGFLFGYLVPVLYWLDNVISEKKEIISLLIVLGASLLCLFNTNYFHDKKSSILGPIFALLIYLLSSLERIFKETKNKKPHQQSQ